MYQINLINTLLKEYKVWTLKLNSSTKKIENTILQKDITSAFEEKIISIGISSLLVYIATGIMGIFGMATGGFMIGVVFFAIGWMLSKIINKKVFGTPRKKEDLAQYELDLLLSLEKVFNTHKIIRDDINQNRVIVQFKDYIKLNRQFRDITNSLNSFDTSKLAYKYKTKFLFVVSGYKKEIKKFDAIYAHKG